MSEIKLNLNKDFLVPEDDSEFRERKTFEQALQDLMPVGVTVTLTWKKGRYIADFAQLHWLMWQKARAA